MKKAEIKALLKEEFDYKSSNKTSGVFGEIEIGSSGPMDCTSAGFERRRKNTQNFESFLKTHKLETEIVFHEVDRWSYAGVKGADYDRDYRTYFLQLSWKV